MSDSVTIYLTIVRHGNTDGNRKWIVDGGADVYSLNSRGWYQATMVGERLQDEYFDKVCASGLSRAFQTASCIVQANVSFNNQVQIEKNVLILLHIKNN